MSRPTLSLRKHLFWLLLLKLVAIVAIKLTFFPSLKEQHLPVELFEPSPASQSALKEPS